MADRIEGTKNGSDGSSAIQSLEPPEDLKSSSFMQAEYEHHLSEFRRNEELGESRVNLFLAIITAVLGGGAFLFIKAMSDAQECKFLANEIYLIIACAFVVTLLFGYVTLLRLVHRNLASSEELRASHRIKKYFTERDPPICEYLYYEPYDNIPKREGRWKKGAIFGIGGFVETVMLINAILVAILAVIVIQLVANLDYLKSVPNWIGWHIALICVIIFPYIAWKWQSNLVEDKYKEVKIVSQYPEDAECK
jgi:hypothetical protein